MSLLEALGIPGKSTPDLPRIAAEASTDRRRLLTAAGSVLAALWSAATATAGAPAPRPLFLVRRASMGLTAAELASAESPPAGYSDYVDWQLDYENIAEDAALLARLSALTTLTTPAYLLADLPQNQVVNELIEAAILRGVFSTRQLFERMVEFWTDHFNIDIRNGIDSFLKTVDDREVIRTHALGTFPDLLRASAMSPAMLYYLDNVVSVAGNPNENYARELMELHTLGVNGGYTQQDVVEVARCFTGWTMYQRAINPPELRYTFRYNSAIHDNGQKVVLGNVIPAGGGQNDAFAVLDILATHASTAAFISGKLCRWFWGENPPQSLVDAVAATYTATGGDIREMVRTLFANTDENAAGVRYKRPYHIVVSGLRATGATITSTGGLRTQLTAAGQLPFHWSPPDGYPDALDRWVGLILPRWNFAASLLNGNIAGSSVSIDALLGGANTADAVADVIDDKLFGGAMPADQKTKIRDYLLPNPPSTTRKRDAVGLALSAPEFQWY